jgi:hypothetical protein
MFRRAREPIMIPSRAEMALLVQVLYRYVQVRTLRPPSPSCFCTRYRTSRPVCLDTSALESTWDQPRRGFHSPHVGERNQYLHTPPEFGSQPNPKFHLVTIPHH